LPSTSTDPDSGWPPSIRRVDMLYHREHGRQTGGHGTVIIIFGNLGTLAP
jgi:hypothetical protein